MPTLWEVGDTKAPYADGFMQLEERDDAGFEFMVSDGAEGISFKVSAEQLLDLAYTIYEELG